MPKITVLDAHIAFISTFNWNTQIVLAHPSSRHLKSGKTVLQPIHILNDNRDWPLSGKIRSCGRPSPLIALWPYIAEVYSSLSDLPTPWNRAHSPLANIREHLGRLCVHFTLATNSAIYMDFTFTTWLGDQNVVTDNCEGSHSPAKSGVLLCSYP